MLGDLGAQAVFFPKVDEEVRARIPYKVVERFPRMSERDKYRMTVKLEKHWESSKAQMSELNPEVGAKDIKTLRELFEKTPRDLSRHTFGPKKDPIPDEPDLLIMAQAAKLAEQGPTFLISKDAHFTGYADLIEGKTGVAVVDALQLPSLLEEWRTKR